MPKQRKRPITGNDPRTAPDAAKPSRPDHAGPLRTKSSSSHGTSHRATQSTIATYHTLLKRRSQLQSILAAPSSSTHALSAKVQAAEVELKFLDERMAALGGLEGYQVASTLGQDKERGGDSSRILVDWLKELGEGWRSDRYGDRRKQKSLEIGALSPMNLISRLPFIHNHPIDLNARHPDIVKQDFLERPVPVKGAERWVAGDDIEVLEEMDEDHDLGATHGEQVDDGEFKRGETKRRRAGSSDRDGSGSPHDLRLLRAGPSAIAPSAIAPGGRGYWTGGNHDKFDIVSCSLVLNFVPDPGDRGKMLRLIHSQLRPSDPTCDPPSASYLFLVLPTPCLTNSRYLTPEHYLSLMQHIGFELVKERMKEGGKVAYSLWRWVVPPGSEAERLKAWTEGGFGRKRLINEGKKRNNFVILLKEFDI